MNQFEWDGLNPGDVVYVHEPLTSALAAVRGTVEFVAKRARRGNEVGIDLGTRPVVWPSWQAVHREPTGVAGSCWRCDDVAKGGTHA